MLFDGEEPAPRNQSESILGKANPKKAAVIGRLRVLSRMLCVLRVPGGSAKNDTHDPFLTCRGYALRSQEKLDIPNHLNRDLSSGQSFDDLAGKMRPPTVTTGFTLGKLELVPMLFTEVLPCYLPIVCA